MNGLVGNGLQRLTGDSGLRGWDVHTSFSPKTAQTGCHNSGPSQCIGNINISMVRISRSDSGPLSVVQTSPRTACCAALCWLYYGLSLLSVPCPAVIDAHFHRKVYHAQRTPCRATTVYSMLAYILTTMSVLHS